MKKWTLIAVLIALGAGGVFFWMKSSAGADEAAAEAPEIVVAQRESLKESVECTGRVVSNLNVEIKCKASGEVIALPFDVSDHVKKGDLLMEIDPIDQQRNLQQAEASLAASKARLAQARANLEAAEKNLTADRARTQAAILSAQARVADAEAKAERDQELLVQKHVSVEEADTSRTTAAEAEANLRTAQAELDAIDAKQSQLEANRQEIRLAEVQIESDEAALGLAKQRLTETKVLSPIDGVVSARPVQIGQIISSGISNVGGGTSVMTVSDLSRIFVLASVDESDIGEVRVGQPAVMTADAFAGVEYTGEVQRIASTGTNVSNVVTFEVKIEVTSENKSMLKPEMTANVEVLVAQAENALTVPVRALVRKGTDTFVTRVEAAQQNLVPVKLGINNGNVVEVIEGLNEGDQVLLVRADDSSRWRNEERRGPPPVFGRKRE